MSQPPSDADALVVRARYPSFCRGGAMVALGNHGGFSGAALWRIDGPAGPLCLRAGPRHDTRTHLLFRHHLMTLARGGGLSFVPTVFAAADGTTGVEHAGRLWELTEWMPGRADFRDRPSAARLEAACTALAQLHLCWAGLASEEADCPAVGRRLAFVADWRRLVRSGWGPLAAAGRADPLRPLVERAWRRLPSAVEEVAGRLLPWAGRRRRVQPCLCDVWHDHLLFEDDRLTGLIDYGAAKVDHVAADLARLLGSLVGSDAEGWREGLRAYRRLAPLGPEEEELAHALDETGVVLGAANWMRWLYEEKRASPDHPSVARRLADVVERLETLYK